MAATLNVTQGGITDREIAALAVEHILASQRGAPSPAPFRIRQLARSVRGNHFQHAPYRPRAITFSDIDHASYVTHLLHPSTGDASQSLIAETLLGHEAEHHAQALDDLRSQSRQSNDTAYATLLGGRCGTVARGACDRIFSGHARDTLIDISRTHARCLVIRSAHDRIADIRLHSVEPVGDRFAGFNSWHSAGSSCLAMIAAPAALLQKLPSQANNIGCATATDDKLFERLVDKQILPAVEGRRIMTIARLAADMLRDKGIHDIDSDALLAAIARTCSAAARLNQGHMKVAGWSQIDFAEFRTGLSAAEASAFVGLEMLRALKHIDDCIAAIEQRRPLPRRPDLVPTKRPLAFASVILRAEGLPDKAAKPHDPSLANGHLDQFRGSGRTSVASMLSKIEKPDIQRRAHKLLGIDASIWFRR